MQAIPIFTTMKLPFHDARLHSYVQEDHCVVQSTGSRHGEKKLGPDSAYTGRPTGIQLA